MILENTTEKPWWLNPAAEPDEAAKDAALARQMSLTKPKGSLGRLEDIAVKFAAWQGCNTPKIHNTCVRVFAADHGVCAQGVSAFPQAVTSQMIQNFVAGGAAVSVLAKRINADFAVVNLGTVAPVINASGVIDRSIAAGTRDLSVEAAMSMDQCIAALNVGREMAGDYDLFIGGEMGIGNTTSTAAIFSALLGLSAEQTVGRGTGIDDAALQVKKTVVERALSIHKNAMGDPLTILCSLGGFEIAALTGAYIASAQARVPSLVDGFISTAAALLAIRLNPSVGKWLMLSHLSAELGHARVLEAFGEKPLLDFALRLGEGSGACVAVTLLQSALDLHNHMATFDDAKVSQE